jgi:hypothetical protein
MPQLPNTLCRGGWMRQWKSSKKGSAIARTFPRESKGTLGRRMLLTQNVGSGPSLHAVKLRSTYHGYGLVLIKSPWSKPRVKKEPELCAYNLHVSKYAYPRRGEKISYIVSYLSGTVSREIFEHYQDPSCFARPTGYTLTSFGFFFIELKNDS